MQTDPDALRKFTLEILREARDGYDLDDAWVQVRAAQLGLLESVRVEEPCGPHCICAEVDDFPQSCLRIASWLLQEDDE